MDTPTITCKPDHFGGYLAQFQGRARQLATVSQPIDKSRWSLHLCVIVPWQKSFMCYRTKEKAMSQAERWLRLRYERIAKFNSTPEPEIVTNRPVYQREPEIPFPNGPPHWPTAAASTMISANDGQANQRKNKYLTLQISRHANTWLR
jgi:hypothetical protein